MANEATDATESTKAGKADVANKAGNADEAKANEANEAKANEAGAKADEAIEAIVTNEIEANVIGEIIAANKKMGIDKVVAVNEANVAVDEAHDTIEALLGFKVNLFCYRRRICRMKIFQLLA